MMLKKTASFVLGSSKSSTYPTWETSCLGSSGWAGEESYAYGFDSPAALLDGILINLGSDQFMYEKIGR
jgi:hypothetical protein